jgi:hypothetical protein
MPTYRSNDCSGDPVKRVERKEFEGVGDGTGFSWTIKWHTDEEAAYFQC